MMSALSIIHVALAVEIIYKPEIFSLLYPLSGDEFRMASLDSFKSRKKLTVGRKTYHYFRSRPRRGTDLRASGSCRFR